MTYTYKCPKCSKVFIIKKSANEASREEFCSNCNIKAVRVWNANFIVPENMKTENIQQMSEVNSKLRHSRPSGRSQIYF